MRRATLKDVAARSGFSVSTVSRYINSSGYVDTASANTIQAAIDALNYTPNIYARSLKTDATRQILLIVPDIMNPYYANIFREAQQLAAKDDYVVLLYDAIQSYENEMRAFAYAGELGVDGVIYCSLYQTSDMGIMERLRAIHKPVVVDALYTPHYFDTLHGEHGNGIYMAAQYLMEQGHRKIGYVGGTPRSNINLRRKGGFLRALAERNLTTPEDWLFEMDFTLDAGYKAGKYFAALDNCPTAICAANDVLAIGLITAFNERGVKVPEDVSITGEDNIEFARTYRPALTTIDNSSTLFARRAYAMLAERLLNRYDGPPRREVSPRKLIVRESTRAIGAGGETGILSAI